jgi:hypothetical protein
MPGFTPIWAISRIIDFPFVAFGKIGIDRSPMRLGRDRPFACDAIGTHVGASSYQARCAAGRSTRNLN